VNIKNHHKNDGLYGERKNMPYLRIESARVRNASSGTQGTCVWAISDAVSTSTSPSDTHRFVRLFLMDASQRVRSVRPAHQGYHQESGWGGERMRVRWVYVPEKRMLALSQKNACKIEGLKAESDKAET
jgi:hypothetical protein